MSSDAPTLPAEWPAPPTAAGVDGPQRFMKRRKRTPMHLKINVTSLIDVTFLLLVYFMVATSFTAGEGVYRMDLPNREGIGADPFDLDDEPLRILVASTGLGPEMCTVRLDGPFPQPESFEALHQFLRAKQVSEMTTGALFESDHPIVIQPTRATLWEHAMEAFNSAARAGYTNVTLAKPG